MNNWIPIFVPINVREANLLDIDSLERRNWTSLGDVCIRIAPNWGNQIQTHPKQSVARTLVFIGKSPQIEASTDCQNNLTRYVRLESLSLTSSLKRDMTKSVVLK